MKNIKIRHLKKTTVIEIEAPQAVVRKWALVNSCTSAQAPSIKLRNFSWRTIYKPR